MPLPLKTPLLQAELPPKTIAERTARVYTQGHPYTPSTDDSTLSPSDRFLWVTAHFARTPALFKKLPNKAQKDVWKTINETTPGLPLRALPERKKKQAITTTTAWGRDRFGADIGAYPPEQFAQRCERAVQLAALEGLSRAFLEKRERERAKWVDSTTNEIVSLESEEIREEKLRRKEIAALRMELYGERAGAYATDPEWDDVVPMPVEDGEGALAAIAYPEDYAEGMLSFFFSVVILRLFYYHGMNVSPNPSNNTAHQPSPTSAPSWPKKNTRRAPSA